MKSFHFQVPPITMGKRRNAEKKNYTGGEGIITTSKGYGGGESNNNKFSVFAFDDDDLRVEIESRKTVAKFGTKSPGKKPAHHRQAVDKYVFLECFAQGTSAQPNYSGSDVLDVDVTDSASRNINFGINMTVSPDYDRPSFLKHHDFGYSSRGIESFARASRQSEGYTTGKKHNKVLYVDPNEDGRMDLRSSSSFDLAETEGSLKEQSSEYGAKDNDCEAVVVVFPHYVKYANMHDTRCRLTFSQRCIRLEESPLCERKGTYCLEWSTFDILKIEYRQCASVKADVVNLHLKSKGKNVTGSWNWNSGSVELEFVVLDDPQWSEKLEAMKSLDPKYKAAWETIISECNFDESFEGIIYPDGDPDAVFISRRDIELLQPRTFINDTIIDFYIKYLVNKTNLEKQHRFHFFNTFFFQKLVDKGRDLYISWDGSDAFQRVHKWTRNINIFEKDFIFIPVNFSLHWSLIVICHPGQVANLRDKAMDSSTKVPCILHMDSISGSHEGLESLIRSYLLEEWKERGNKQEDISEKFLNLEFIALQLPQQENSFDCGLFLLHYAELFLEQVPNFGATKYVDFLNKDWFLAAEVSLKKRDHIRRLIHRIVKDNALKVPPAARNDKHLQSGKSEGDGSPNSIQQYDLKESHLCRKFNSSNEFEIKGQQSFSAMCEQNSSVINESFFQPYKLLMPINQFNNMTLPVEDTIDRASSRRGVTASSDETDGDDKFMPSRYPLSSSAMGKMKVPRKTSSSTSPIIIDVPNEDDCVSEVASSIERQKKRYVDSWMSSEDLEMCVVDDSEEESETESIIRTRKSSYMVRTTGSIM